MWPRQLLAAHPAARRWLIGSVVCGVAAAVALIGWTLLLARVITDVFVGGRSLSQVAPVLVAMAVLLVVRAGFTWTAEITGQRASGRLRAEVRHDLSAHLVAVGPAGLNDERTGEIGSTIGAGVDALDRYVSTFLPAAALSAIVPLLVLGTIFLLDPLTTPILLFAGPMLILLLILIGGRTRVLTQRRFAELGWLSSFYLDMIRGMATLKAYGRADDGAETIGGVSTRYGDTTMDVLRTAFQTSLVMEWAATAATALVAVQVSFRLISDNLSFGTALAVLVLTPEFFVPLRRLALEYHAGQTGRTAIERIEEIERLPVPPRSGTATVGAGGAPDRLGNGALVLSSVGFTYPGATRPALVGVDLRVEEGEAVALTGPSGAGKTTALALVMRFIDPSEGEVTAGGVPISRIDPGHWRRHVAWVPQSPTLFAGSVADNIRLGDPDATMEQVRAAAAAARAEEFVDALPDGFDTVLGEQGLRLSGGQRQRLAIARAAIRDAPFVVLDEFTAHLDHDTEIEVLSAIGELLRGRTALIVAHRRSTIAFADRTVVLDEGRLSGTGR